MFAFNGQYPGPLIEMTRGAEVTSSSPTIFLSQPPSIGMESASTTRTMAHRS